MLKAQLLSQNKDFCLSYIRLLRRTNSPSYSAPYWRFFEGCIDEALLRVVVPNEIQTIGLARPERTSPEVARELFKDHWFSFLAEANHNDLFSAISPSFELLEKTYAMLTMIDSDPVREQLLEILRALREDPSSAELLQDYRETLIYSSESI